MKNIANLNNYLILNKKNPIGYTYNLISCFAILFKRENTELLIHVYSEGDKYDKEHFIKALNLNDDVIISAEIFKGSFTSDNVIENVTRELYERDIDYEVKDSYINVYNEGSIGYNHNEKCYYKVNDYQKLEKMGQIVKKLD